MAIRLNNQDFLFTPGEVFQGTAAADELVVAANNVQARSFTGDDRITVLGDNAFVNSGAGNDRVISSGDDGFLRTLFGRDTVVAGGDRTTVDAGDQADLVVVTGNDTVVNGGNGNDVLRGSGGVDSLWGGAGDDVISTGGGTDYALGGAGNDVTDTGTGLGIHFGGAGNDTFRIGANILNNNAVDTVIALDFGAGDTLQIAPSVVAAIDTTVEGQVDIAPVLAAFTAAGLSVEEAGQRLSQTAGGVAIFNEVTAFLAPFTANAQGQVFVPATTVTLDTGDVIIAVGVTQAALLDLLA